MIRVVVAASVIERLIVLKHHAEHRPWCSSWTRLRFWARDQMPPGTGTRGPGMCTKAGARHGAWHQVEKKRNYFAVPGAPFLVRNRSSQSEASTTGTSAGATTAVQ